MGVLPCVLCYVVEVTFGVMVNEREDFWNALIGDDDPDEDIIVSKQSALSPEHGFVSAHCAFSRVLVSKSGVGLALLYATPLTSVGSTRTRLVALKVTCGRSSLWLDRREAWDDLERLKEDVLCLLEAEDMVIEESRLWIGGKPFGGSAPLMHDGGEDASEAVVLNVEVSGSKRRGGVALARDLGVSIKQAVIMEFAATVPEEGEVASLVLDVKSLSLEVLQAAILREVTVGVVLLFVEIRGFGNNASSRALFAQCVGIEPDVIVPAAFGESVEDRLLLVYQHVRDVLLLRVGCVESAAIYKLISRSMVLAAALRVGPEGRVENDG